MAQFMHNMWINTTMKKTLYDLLFRFTPSVQTTCQKSEVPEIEWRKDWLKWARTKAQESMTKVQQVWRQQSTKGRRPHDLKEGDQVWLEGTNL